MSRFIQNLKTNKVVIHSGNKKFETNHLKGLLFLFGYSGLSAIIGFILLGIFGNGIMLISAFIAPAVLYYIYTLCEDFVNPLFTKIGFEEVNKTNEKANTVEPQVDEDAVKPS